MDAPGRFLSGAILLSDSRDSCVQGNVPKIGMLNISAEMDADRLRWTRCDWQYVAVLSLCWRKQSFRLCKVPFVHGKDVETMPSAKCLGSWEIHLCNLTASSILCKQFNQYLKHWTSLDNFHSKFQPALDLFVINLVFIWVRLSPTSGICSWIFEEVNLNPLGMTEVPINAKQKFLKRLDVLNDASPFSSAAPVERLWSF